MQGLFQTWAGEASNWECDELGHLNMRYYAYKVAQARQMLFLKLGLTRCFSQGAHASVDVLHYHIKYMAEAHPGSPLRIFSAITDLDTHEMSLVHVMYHADDRVACTVTERVRHIYLCERRPFNWPQRVMKAAKAFQGAIPDSALPRGLDLSFSSRPITHMQAEDAGMRYLGCGVFRLDEADVFGRVTPQALLGRVTQTVGQFTQAWPEMFLEDFGRSRVISGALLEAQVALSEPVHPGEGYVFYSAITTVNPNVRTLVHKLFDVTTGAQIMSMQGVGCLIDLTARKHVKTSPEMIESMTAACVDVTF